MTEYNFKKFEGFGGKFDDRISVTKSNFIGFPRVFCQTNDIDKYKSVELFFDEDNKAIGIKFYEEEVPKTYRLNYNANSEGAGASIAARSFFKANHIDTNKYSGKYQVKIHDDQALGRLFVIELTEHAST